MFVREESTKKRRFEVTYISVRSHLLRLMRNLYSLFRTHNTLPHWLSKSSNCSILDDLKCSQSLILSQKKIVSKTPRSFFFWSHWTDMVAFQTERERRERKRDTPTRGMNTHNSHFLSFTFLFHFTGRRRHVSLVPHVAEREKRHLEHYTHVNKKPTEKETKSKDFKLHLNNKFSTRCQGNRKTFLNI